MKLDSSLLLSSELATIAQNLCVCMYNGRDPNDKRKVSAYGQRLDNQARNAIRRIAAELMARAAFNPCHFC